MSKIDDRYQNQKWYVKLWRRRHYLLIPKMAFSIWLGGRNPGHCWDIAAGLAQSKMKWYFTWEEVKADIYEED